MGLQRKVPGWWKLETRRLASLCEKSVILKKRSFVHRGAIFKGPHIVGIRRGQQLQLRSQSINLGTV
ncbi:hypothetical protein RchiOBHm_Chr2g0124371 [Rosa chinensis]|uniref:Uncharacterized protein n=1 Tax=Rosa chinensis TaxID=74649 RepID=A0A2P6RT97_ROSCH|nr:hypothetical protein RchiOBHm_Chr2g0124371 [Rosa chinensis]